MPLIITIAVAVAAVAAALALLWHFVGYALCMGLVGRRATDRGGEPSSTPSVSIIVPTYNEVEVAADRVENLRALRYPPEKYEVLFVDSGSTDGTREALRDAVRPEEPPSVSVITEEKRAGKASAINVGLARASGDVVLVSDANTMFDPDVLRQIAPHFDDPDVGAVAGRKQLPEAEGSLTGPYQFYRDLERLKATGETVLDSACQFVGELSAWRRGIARADTDSLSEDLDLSVRIRKKGYRIAYEPEAVAYEREPEEATEQVATNKRRTIGVLQTLAKHWRFLSTPVDTYRALIFPSRKTLQVLSPFLFLAAVGLYALVLSTAPYLGAVALGVPLVVGIASVAAIPRVTASFAPERAEAALSVGSLVGVARYLVLMEYTILLAWWEFLSSDYSVLWTKSDSDRPSAD